jgi:hypothetical protein
MRSPRQSLPSVSSQAISRVNSYGYAILLLWTGSVVVRHDPRAWERRGVPSGGTPRKTEDNVWEDPDA